MSGTLVTPAVDSVSIVRHKLSPEEAAHLESDRRASMRERVRMVAWWLVGVSPLLVFFIWIAPTPAGVQPAEIQGVRIVGIIGMAIFAILWVGIAWRSRDTREYRWVRFWALILLLTAVLGPSVAAAMIIFHDTGLAPGSETPAITAAQSIVGSWAVLSAAAILIVLPWSVREVLIASIAIGALILVLSLPEFIESDNPMDTLDVVLNIVLLTVISVGIGLSKAQARREAFGRASMADHVARVSRELEIAREVHDSVFPSATRARGWRFDFHYEPMQQIGGDYAFLRPLAGARSGGIIAGLIDVTGHGIASALTVNRLHGEIDRFLADHPEAGPEDLLGALNRYLYFTLSEKSIFATAICVRCGGGGAAADGVSGRVEYASAGHPPMMVRRAGTKVESFGATGPVLGALPPEAFELRRETVELAPGERLLAFTDGILEAKGDRGEMLWVEGVRDIIAQLGPGPAGEQVTAAVRAYRRGPALDDVLVMEVARSAD